MSSIKIKINDKKIINAWTMYDWANSVFPLVITSAIFPIFYESTTEDIVSFFGIDFVNTEIYSYVISLSYIVVAFLSPILSGIADYSGKKKSFMQFFCYLGALSTITLYFFNADMLELSMLSFFLASIGFSGSLVFYNAYLPEIATPDLHDRVSAKGFAQGYIGSSLLLIICLVLIQVFEQNPAYSFLLTGLWWLGFSQITFNTLPNNIYSKKIEGNKLTKGFEELKKVWTQIKQLKSLKRYLGAFFVYSMGVQTVMLMAVFFGTKEIDWPSESEKQTGLIVSILVIQFIAVVGAYLMAYVSKKIGNIKTLIIVVFIWALICIVAYAIVRTPLHFYIIAAVIGFVMGGVQSLSRSTYSKLLPETEDHASFFSFYDVLEKGGIVIGTFSFGFIDGIFSIREAVLALIVFFIVGLLLLFRVPKDERLL
jgi:UMF1 family MFS transporter